MRRHWDDVLFDRPARVLVSLIFAGHRIRDRHR